MEAPFRIFLYCVDALNIQKTTLIIRRTASWLKTSGSSSMTSQSKIRRNSSSSVGASSVFHPTRHLTTTQAFGSRSRPTRAKTGAATTSTWTCSYQLLQLASSISCCPSTAVWRCWWRRSYWLSTRTASAWTLRSADSTSTTGTTAKKRSEYDFKMTEYQFHSRVVMFHKKLYICHSDRKSYIQNNTHKYTKIIFLSFYFTTPF